MSPDVHLWPPPPAVAGVACPSSVVRIWLLVHTYTCNMQPSFILSSCNNSRNISKTNPTFIAHKVNKTGSLKLVESSPLSCWLVDQAETKSKTNKQKVTQHHTPNASPSTVSCGWRSYLRLEDLAATLQKNRGGSKQHKQNSRGISRPGRRPRATPLSGALFEPIRDFTEGKIDDIRDR